MDVEELDKEVEKLEKDRPKQLNPLNVRDYPRSRACTQFMQISTIVFFM